MTINELIDRYLTHVVGKVNEETIIHLRIFLVPFCECFGSRPAEGCTPAEVERWIDSNAHRWRSRFTKRTAFRYVYRVYLWGVRVSLLAHNPLRRPREAPKVLPPPASPALPTIPPTGLETVDEVLALYLAQNRRQICREVWQDRKSLFAQFTRQYGGLTIAAARPYHLKLWMEAMPQWRSGYTRQRVLAAFKVAMNWALKLGLIDRNPFHGGYQSPKGSAASLLSLANSRRACGAVRPYSGAC